MFSNFICLDPMLLRQLSDCDLVTTPGSLHSESCELELFQVFSCENDLCFSILAYLRSLPCTAENQSLNVVSLPR